ncbi:hypothetical protein C0992_008704, partial [Termitomyces sp. T32_za158]
IVTNKLLEKINTPTLANNVLTFKTLPSSLQHQNYPEIQFWTKSSYEKHVGRTAGDTDGLATQKPRRGRPPRDTTDKKHPYLEDEDGKPVKTVRLHEFGEKFRRLLNSLKTKSLHRATWRELDDNVIDYLQIEMEREFLEFRLCEGSWKLGYWAPRVYASWMQNQRKHEQDSAYRSSKTQKRQRSRSHSNSTESSLDLPPSLDDSTLIKMDIEAPAITTLPNEAPSIGCGEKKVSETATCHLVTLIDPLTLAFKSIAQSDSALPSSSSQDLRQVSTFQSQPPPMASMASALPTSTSQLMLPPPALSLQIPVQASMSQFAQPQSLTVMNTPAPPTASNTPAQPASTPQSMPLPPLSSTQVLFPASTLQSAQPLPTSATSPTTLTLVPSLSISHAASSFPLVPIHNTLANSTRPSKKIKSVPLAIVGTGYTD